MRKLSVSKNLELFPPYFFRELDRKKQEAVKSGKSVLSFAVGDPDNPTPLPIVKYAGLQLQNCLNHRYPEGKGSLKLRTAICKWHYKRHGIKLDPETQVLVLIGSKEGIAHLPFAILDPKDPVLLPDPAYPAYKTGLVLSGARIMTVALKEENQFLPDFDSIPKSMLSKAKLLFLNYPNNPTGAIADIGFYNRVVHIAKKHSIWVAQDAAYSEICFAGHSPSILQIPGAVDVAVEFHSLSKSFNMTGWRLAWMCGNPQVINALGRLKEHIDSGPFNAIQETAIYALEHAEKFIPQIVKTYKTRKEYFVENLRKLNWKVFEPGGTFFVWAKPPVKMDSMKCALQLLNYAGIIAAPGTGFGRFGQGFVRFSMTVPDAQIREAINRLSKIQWEKND
jgi:LL-diaminopimelate aminotransferase